MARYRLTAEGNYAWEGDNALEVVEHMWDSIKEGWSKGWVLEDTAPKLGQHVSVWTLYYSTAYNGVELSPLVGTR